MCIPPTSRPQELQAYICTNSEHNIGLIASVQLMSDSSLWYHCPLLWNYAFWITSNRTWISHLQTNKQNKKGETGTPHLLLHSFRARRSRHQQGRRKYFTNRSMENKYNLQSSFQFMWCRLPIKSHFPSMNSCAKRLANPKSLNIQVQVLSQGSCKEILSARTHNIEVSDIPGSISPWRVFDSGSEKPGKGSILLEVHSLASSGHLAMSN